MKHYGSYHGVFNRILKDMGLLDAREDLSRTGVKFPRPKIERVFTAGPGNNLALELARTAAIWSGGMKEEEEVLKEVLALRELERTVDKAITDPAFVKNEVEVKKEETVQIKQEPVDPEESSNSQQEPVNVQVKKEPGEEAVKKEFVDDDEKGAECCMCDNLPKMTSK